MTADDQPQTPGYGKRISDRLPTGEPLEMTTASRSAYLYANAFEALVAVSAIIASVAFFARPSALVDTSIGRTLHPFDMVWNVLYFMGGLTTFLGLWLNRSSVHFLRREIYGYSVELAGIIFLSTAVAVNAVAATSVGGFTSVTATYTAVVLACVARGRAIMAQRKVGVSIEVPAGNGGTH